MLGTLRDKHSIVQCQTLFAQISNCLCLHKRTPTKFLRESYCSKRMRVQISMVHLCSSRANSLNSAVGASGLCSPPHLRHQVVRSRDLRHHHHHHYHKQNFSRSPLPSTAKNNISRNISTFGIKLTGWENQDNSTNKPPMSPLLKA